MAIYHGTVAVCPSVTHQSSGLILILFVQADFPIDKILTKESDTVKELIQKSRTIKFDIQVCDFIFSV